jgi:hypothetical protein
MYLMRNETVFNLIPSFDKDSIIAIIGLLKKFPIIKGVQIGKTVKDILQYYPKA